jgi:hypothetical protein
VKISKLTRLVTAIIEEDMVLVTASDIPRRGRMARGLLVDWFRRKYGLGGRWFALLIFPEPQSRDKSK